MRRLSALLLLALLPTLAAAQSPGDTVEVVIPEDVNCSDFEAVLGAQPWFEAGQILTGTDIYRLDGDGNGVACEGLDFIRHRVTVDDSTGHVYETWSTEQPAEARCPWTGRFDIDEHVQQMRRAPIDTVDNERAHDDRTECLHVLGEIEQLGQ